MFENDRLDWKHIFLPSPNGNLEEMKRLSKYYMIINIFLCFVVIGIYLTDLEFISFISQTWNLSHRFGIYVYGILSV